MDTDSVQGSVVVFLNMVRMFGFRKSCKFLD
jgi:hypothetical protein